MNLDLISILVFYSILLFLFLIFKKKFAVQGILVLYRTKLGLRIMNRLSKLNPTAVKLFANLGVIVGFLGMLFGFGFLVKETLTYLTVPEAVAPLVPLLPGITIPGVPTLSFWHWIIGIFIAAVVHEFSHGTIARFYNVPIKSSGFAFLGPILAAFVEPDEKILQRKRPMKQLGIFAAGPFSNIILGALFFLVFTTVTGPLWVSSFTAAGITANSVVEGSPAADSGMPVPFTITKINDKDTLNSVQFVEASLSLEPGEKVVMETDCGARELTATANPENASRGYLGFTDFEQKFEPAGRAEGKPWLLEFFRWLHLLVMWLFVINIGIAIFNLLPFTPADGGKMLLVGLQSVFPRKGRDIWLAINIITIALIVINLLPWVFKFLAWVLKLFIMVVTFGFA